MKSNALNLKLALLQVEQYDTGSYLAKRNNIDPNLALRMRMTGRLKVTALLSRLTGIVVANIIISVFVSAAQKLVWHWVKTRIEQLKNKGLKVVAIAGSYGKTSVKHYSYELLRREFRVVATPESFNTVFGIAKCLFYEVDVKTQIFLVEVGAYHIGDITYLLRMVQPEVGVLTGIARQHLERFGSFENIKKAKGEIAEYMKETGRILIANKCDRDVVEIVDKLGVNATFYGQGQDRNEINLDGARKLANHFGVKKFNPKIRQVKNRFEMTTERYGMKVIDDSFSSNDRGFADAVKYLGKQTKYTRILVTPGLVELGLSSREIHEQLGSLIPGQADYVILVGKNERTESLERGIGGKVKVIYIEKTLEFMRTVKTLSLKKEPIVLLENDVTENYN